MHVDLIEQYCRKHSPELRGWRWRWRWLRADQTVFPPAPPPPGSFLLTTSLDNGLDQSLLYCRPRRHPPTYLGYYSILSSVLSPCRCQHRVTVTVSAQKSSQHVHRRHLIRRSRSGKSSSSIDGIVHVTANDDHPFLQHPIYPN